MVEKKTSSEYGLPMSAENHDNPLAFLGQAVLVANLQKKPTDKIVAEAKLIASFQHIVWPFGKRFL